MREPRDGRPITVVLRDDVVAPIATREKESAAGELAAVVSELAPVRAAPGSSR